MRSEEVLVVSMLRGIATLATVILFSIWSEVWGAESGETSVSEEISLMNIKEIKNKLKERGLECRNCLTKEEHQDLLFGGWDRPLLVEKSGGESKKGSNQNKRRPTIQEPTSDQRREAMAEMDRRGFGRATSVSPDDLHGLGEAEIRDQILGRSNRKTPDKASGKQKSSKKRQDRGSKANGNTSDGRKKEHSKSAGRKTAKKQKKKENKVSKRRRSSTKRNSTKKSTKKTKKTKKKPSKGKKKDVDEERLRRSMADQFIEEDLWGQYYGNEERQECDDHLDTDIIEL